LKWLLDTNVVSEAVHRHPNQRALDWINQRPPPLIAISIVTIAELRLGARMTADPRRRVELTRWIDEQVEPSFSDHTLPLSLEILIDWLELGRRGAVAGKTRSPADLLLASTARVHDLIIVSRNVRDFVGTGVLVYDPWSGKTHQMDLA
jgi:toxin FitB